MCDPLAAPDVVTGTACNSAQRRTAGKFVFFCDLQGEGEVHHILCKSEQRGGQLSHETVLALRKTLRQGDTLQVHVGEREWFTPREGFGAPGGNGCDRRREQHCLWG